MLAGTSSFEELVTCVVAEPGEVAEHLERGAAVDGGEDQQERLIGVRREEVRGSDSERCRVTSVGFEPQGAHVPRRPDIQGYVWTSVARAGP